MSARAAMTQGPRRGLPRMRPYQAEIARAVLRRMVRGEGGSVSVEIARQGGKNEVSAIIELLALAANGAAGGSLVKCAPTYAPQAVLSRERLCDRARDAGLGEVVAARGALVRCGRATATFLSAERQANVVGHTASLLLEVDEAQDVEAERFDRAFRPMAASTNAPVVFYGTPWRADSLLAQAEATHRAAERRGGPRRHFRVTWEQVAASNPAYGEYVEGERERLGERHPAFRSQYLLEVIDDAGRLFDAAALAQIEGEHERLAAPVAGERYVAGLDLAGPATDATQAGERDWTVLTVARVRASDDGMGLLDVVEHQAWQGEATERLITTLADRLRRVWQARRVCIDATGLGGPLADLIAARLGRGVVERFVFSAASKSRLGFELLAAAHSGRLRLYRRDGSAQWAECRRQLGAARAAYRADQTMQFGVDEADGHDDYLMSLALAVQAAKSPQASAGARTARGRVTGEMTPMAAMTSMTSLASAGSMGGMRQGEGVRG